MKKVKICYICYQKNYTYVQLVYDWLLDNFTNAVYREISTLDNCSTYTYV
jgi:hypothetical protein